jgi:TonB-linked SusC/RagA family outer membrane protein
MYNDSTSLIVRSKNYVVQHFLLGKSIMLLLLVFFIAGGQGYSQQTAGIRITGTVLDENGSPLTGVSITLKKNTTKGTTTNIDGKYQLTVTDKTSVLVFSFISYNTQETTVGSQTTINIKLSPIENSLNDVIVIGYGTIKKANLTGSVASVNMKQLALAPVKSFDDALGGRVAGIRVTSNDGQPGAAPIIVIRGSNSLTQDNSPLYVIDGFPIENNNNNAINPDDIESISILKDASSTAIYGSRGANGVILITTKRGKVGAPVVSYNGYYGVNKALKKMEVMSTYEFVKEQLENTDPNVALAYLTNPGRTLDDYKKIPTIDWYDLSLQKSFVQSNNLSITGGNQNTRYAISGSILNQTGIFLNTGFTRKQGKISIDQTVNNKLKVGVNVNYAVSRDYGTVATSNGGNVSSALMYSVWGYRPVAPDSTVDLESLDQDPSINPTTDQRINPITQLQNELRESINSNLYTNAYINYNITPNLVLRIVGNMSRALTQSNNFNNSRTRSGNPQYPSSLGVNGSEAYALGNNYSNENTLTYSQKFAKYHNTSLLAGYSQQVNNSSSFGATGVQLPNESLGLSGLDEGLPQSIQSGISKWALQSVFGRLHYDYNSKYLIDATLRADGSSKFSNAHRWGYFPSVGLAYKITNEPFMEKIPIISQAKIRIGYGASGNNRVSDFAYLSSLNFATYNGYSFNNGLPSTGAITSALANPDLKWEITNTVNLGLDLAILKDRISFTGDYYYKRTNDLLLNAQLPYNSGYAQAFKNIGSVSNTGLELTLNTVNVRTTNFAWNCNFNISFNKSKVLSLTQNQESLTSTVGVSTTYNALPAYIAKLGKPVALFYGVIYDGTYKNSDFDVLSNGAYAIKPNITGNGSTRANIRPGDAKYRDLNGDGIINLNDYTVIGDPNPDFIGGFNNDFRYKGFDLSVFFQFSEGNDILNANRNMFENGTPTILNLNQYASYKNRWTPNNPTSDIPRYNGYGQNLYTQRVVEDGSFLRLKTVSLGYNIPKQLLQKLGVKFVRVYASGQNLYTWTNYSGIDPEVSTRQSTLTPGLDFSPYPRQRTFVFGINVSF